ncbi:hypothetical protein DAEQUDRAFT_769726 [Daedalea quercina L-15889]|uniref:Uncharacterized protein n=1 Tax=Daedalea quercina L-15889 TaxID=1314783 RepID=A0A165LG64_9APHY|nr:hypothetical protein DAEQUDRAFT_769726 [Daedalea quercina L-15889]
MVSQLLVAPHTFIRNLDRNGPLADDPLDALCGMDALAQVFDAAVDLYTQQDLLEDAIHEYANARNQATRTMMLRLRDLEDQVVIRATAHDMVPLRNVQYTHDFVISRTFPHLANEDAEARTLPPDVRTLADLMRANVFTPTATRSWRIVADHLFLASCPIMNHYPTNLTPVYFRMKRITLENVTRWFVVHGGRVDGAYYDLQQATEQSLHTGTALVTSYTSREEARASLD